MSAVGHHLFHGRRVCHQFNCVLVANRLSSRWTSRLRNIECRSTNFDDVPLFADSSSVLGPQSAGAATATKPIEQLLDEVELKSEVRATPCNA
jgi:hypothetical protein